MQKNCSKCGAEFHCGADSAGESFSCWCAELPNAWPLPGANEDCLCPACLEEARLSGRAPVESQLSTP